MIVRWLIVFLVSVMCGAGAARAESAMTLDFALRVKEINAFLVASNRLAQSNGAGRRVLGLARRETDRTRLVAAFEDWDAEARRAARAADHAPTIDGLGPMFGPADRSVAIVVHEGPPVLPDLAARRGAGFDTLYLATQRAALDRLVGLYVDFIQNGDDETLRRLAVSDLPRARQLLAQVRGR